MVLTKTNPVGPVTLPTPVPSSIPSVSLPGHPRGTPAYTTRLLQEVRGQM
ncbi:hypothetical protein F751_3723 [Auxenochlorella protothecoides]|uniref:Uncharacterized protein n=1 Tax=Auxenochlorella protothecoides TaxID=3075 RepID=A0A087SG57_AUXPR|nr:hypothetical protein F751_3723 [Auxenochlorella protothecoides]KFM24711.1 hypothetical protein F751_3723 [Auxenochlorella protothecoides]